MFDSGGLTKTLWYLAGNIAIHYGKASLANYCLTLHSTQQDPGRQAGRNLLKFALFQLDTNFKQSQEVEYAYTQK